MRSLEVLTVVVQVREAWENALTNVSWLTWDSQDQSAPGLIWGWDEAPIKEKIDKAYCNEEWKNAFPEAIVRHLPRTRADHCPILMDLCGSDPPNPLLRPFWFEAAWISHQNLSEFVEKECTIKTYMDLMLPIRHETSWSFFICVRCVVFAFIICLDVDNGDDTWSFCSTLWVLSNLACFQLCKMELMLPGSKVHVLCLSFCYDMWYEASYITKCMGPVSWSGNTFPRK